VEINVDLQQGGQRSVSVLPF